LETSPIVEAPYESGSATSLTFGHRSDFLQAACALGRSFIWGGTMRRIFMAVLVVGLGLWNLDCRGHKTSGTQKGDAAGGDPGGNQSGDGQSGDGQGGDGQGGDGQGGGDAIAPVTSTTRIYQTGGGGTTASPSHKAQVFIGAPQPFGKAGGQNANVQAGPKSTP
jgi:hypothetical protein